LKSLQILHWWAVSNGQITAQRGVEVAQQAPAAASAAGAMAVHLDKLV
jgi:hypothetical protein